MSMHSMVSQPLDKFLHITRTFSREECLHYMGMLQVELGESKVRIAEIKEQLKNSSSQNYGNAMFQLQGAIGYATRVADRIAVFRYMLDNMGKP